MKACVMVRRTAALIKSGKVADVSITAAQKNYKKALEKGLLKILSKACHHCPCMRVYATSWMLHVASHRCAFTRKGQLWPLHLPDRWSCAVSRRWASACCRATTAPRSSKSTASARTSSTWPSSAASAASAASAWPTSSASRRPFGSRCAPAAHCRVIVAAAQASLLCLFLNLLF